MIEWLVIGSFIFSLPVLASIVLWHQRVQFTRLLSNQWHLAITPVLVAATAPSLVFFGIFIASRLSGGYNPAENIGSWLQPLAILTILALWPALVLTVALTWAAKAGHLATLFVYIGGMLPLIVLLYGVYGLLLHSALRKEVLGSTTGLGLALLIIMSTPAVALGAFLGWSIARFSNA